ncbi:MAG: sugar ABC transporter permease [Eubacteriales bacterium]|nr:sugar ABC transporter permease [Eubacteriales bacterium]
MKNDTNKSPGLLKKMSKSGMDAYLWLAPCFILMLTFILLPVLEIFRMAFSKISPANLIKEFGTLENFQYLFRQPIFARVMINTVIWTIAIVGISIVLSITLALVLNEEFKGRATHRTILLLPWATSLLITSAAWKYILNTEYGALNTLLLTIGVIKQPINWLANPVSSFTWMIIIGIVVTIPFMTFTLLSGLQSISHDFYEAASIDGANFWQKLFKITLPLLKPAINVTLVLNIIYVFNSFAIVNTITNGAPANQTHTITTYLYYLAFGKNKYGASAALSIVSFVILSVFAVLYMKTQMKEED